MMTSSAAYVLLALFTTHVMFLPVLVFCYQSAGSGEVSSGALDKPTQSDPLAMYTKLCAFSGVFS